MDKYLAERLVDCVQAEAALSSTYAKGLALARAGAVLSCDITSGAIGSTRMLDGKVRGSSSEPYHTTVEFDTLNGDMIDYSCTCPAALSYLGMCKHEIALVLDYLAGEGLGPAYVQPLPRLDTSRYDVRISYTSPSIRAMLEGLTGQRMQRAEAAFAARHSEGQLSEPADLLVTILPSRNSYYDVSSWCVKLRVRCGKVSYVVKNIAELVNAYHSGATLRYGKNLAFAHVPSAFTERARHVIEIVSRVAESQQALYISRWRYQEAGRGTELKDLPMASHDLIEVLDALEGTTVAFEEDAYRDYRRSNKPRQLAVVAGDPQVRVRLLPADKEGFDVMVEGADRCFVAGDRMYVLDESHAYRCSAEFTSRMSLVLPSLTGERSTLHLSSTDVPAFCRDALPLLRQTIEVEAPAGLDDLVPPEATFTFTIGDDDGLITCQVAVAYGAWETELYGDAPAKSQRTQQARWSSRAEKAQEPERDLVAEYHVMDVVEQLFPSGEPGAGELPHFDDDDDEQLFSLLTTGLAELNELGEVLLSERLRAIEVRDSPTPRVRATVTSGLLDVALDMSGMTPQDIVSYLAAYKRRQRFVRLSTGDIMRIGEGARAVDDLAEGLGIDAAELTQGVSGLPENRALFVDGLVKQQGGVRLARNDAFRAIVRDFDTFSDADIDVPASLAGTLRPYQQDGFRWLETLERFGFGGILADDMGLGKTLQMIAHILARKEAESDGKAAEAGKAAGVREAASPAAPTLVVCPASLVYNWMSELARFAPTLDAVAILGTKSARRKLIQAASEHDVLVTSYDLMRRDVDDLAQQQFARMVLDEAQYIKNPTTKVARAAKSIPARVRFALTGTPIENRTAELWSIFDFLMPGLLGTREVFAKEYEGPIEGGEGRPTQRLRCLVAPFILRRLKTDVLTDLPEKTENVIVAHMTGEQEKLYRSSQDLIARQVAHELPEEFKKRKLQILAELTRLRQICCDPALVYENYTGDSAKLDTCLELVADAVDGGHQVLLFSQFTSMLDIIARELEKHGISAFMLTGSTSKEERRRLVERFQAGDVPVFLISLRAGGVGLNLTAADVVIHYDPWWNLAAQNQATDRAHRIGQNRAVSVFKLICADTIEERIIRMQESKRELAESLLSGKGIQSAKLTREDILGLLESVR